MKRILSSGFILLFIFSIGIFMPSFQIVQGVVSSNSIAHAAEATNTKSMVGLTCEPWELTCSLVLFTVKLLSGPPIFLASITGMILDYSLWYSLQSSTYNEYTGSGDANDTGEGIAAKGWKLVRDFSNLVFIFVLFFIAFILILGLDNNPNGSPMGLEPKKAIARVIIIALLVNFSFFFGRVVIDFGNVIGLSFYNKITAAPVMSVITNQDQYDTGDGANSVKQFYTGATGIRSISTSILSKINPQNFLADEKSVKGTPLTPERYGMTMMYGLIILFFGLFLMYIFGSVAIIFITRTMGLILLLIVSPIAFVSYTIPAFQKMNFVGFDDWMKQFFGLAFTAPIFLFFLYIGIQFFTPVGAANTASFALAATIIFKLSLFTFFLLFAKKITTDLSGKIGAIATGVISSVASGALTIGAGVATGGLSGGVAVAGRMAGGAVTRAATSIGGEGSALSNGTQAAIQRLSNTNFRSIGQSFKDLPEKIRGGASALGRDPLGTIGGAVRETATDYGRFLGQSTLGLAKLSGSTFADKASMAVTQGSRWGNQAANGGPSQEAIDRLNRMKKFKELKANKLKEKDKQIEAVAKKLNDEKDPNKKKVLETQLKNLTKERAEIEKPPVKQQTPSQNGQGQPAGGPNPANPTPAPGQPGTPAPVTPQPGQPTPRPASGSGSPTGNQQSLNIGTLRAGNLVVGNGNGGNVSGKPAPAAPQNNQEPRTNSQGRSFGDGKGPKPEYTANQQERILRKAITAEEKRSNNSSGYSTVPGALPENNPSGRAMTLLGNIQSAAVNFKDTPPRTNAMGRSFGDGKSATTINDYNINRQERILSRAIAADEKKNQNEAKAQAIIAEKNTQGQQLNTLDQSAIIPNIPTDDEGAFDFGGIQIPNQNDNE